MEAALPLGSGAVLLDLYLPGLSGIEVLNYLASEQRGNPVIVITAHVEPSTVSQAIQAGAIAMLEKPLQKTLLIDTIRQALLELAIGWSVPARGNAIRTHPNVP